MRTHVTVLGWLYIGLGLLGFLAAAVVLGVGAVVGIAAGGDGAGGWRRAHAAGARSRRGVAWARLCTAYRETEPSSRGMS